MTLIKSELLVLGWKREANPVVCYSSPPRWLDPNGSNFQGLSRTSGRMSSRKNLLKKLKKKKINFLERL